MIKRFGSMAIAAGAFALAVASIGGSTAGAAATTVSFEYTGSVQTWTVPAGVTSATFDVYGAQGGWDPRVEDGCGDTGGLGGRSQVTIGVTPGETISIYVGGQGGSTQYDVAGYGTGGFNGGGDGGIVDPETGDGFPGGGGGGASDVRIGGTSLADRVIVAGGGGGVGAACNGAGNGGAGSGSSPGGTGDQGALPDAGEGGAGGTAVAGGAGGADSGTAGALGQGGTGGVTLQAIQAGGGGGGGLYGGGGGGAGIFVLGEGGDGGSGGGGSGLCPAGCVLAETGVREGNGLVTVTFSAASTPATPVELAPAFTG